MTCFQTRVPGRKWRTPIALAVTGTLVPVALALPGLSGVSSAFCGSHGVCNEPPRVAVKVGEPKAHTGILRIKVSARDKDSKNLRISVPARTSKGRIDRIFWRDGTSSGLLEYTPTSSARHAAARDQAASTDATDTFNVTVSDGEGGTTSVPVTVQISPQNSPPALGVVTVSEPDPTTGLVTGQVNATDADGDPLTYAVMTPPLRGTVTVDAQGAFTYRPTYVTSAYARGAIDSDTDSFTVIITDGYGGASNAPVTVNLPGGAYGPL